MASVLDVYYFVKSCLSQNRRHYKLSCSFSLEVSNWVANVNFCFPCYNRNILSILWGESYHRGDKIDNSKFGADPGLPSEVASGVKTGQNEGKTGTPAFRCKKCRRIVALQDNVVDHIPGEGGKSFEWRKRKSSNLSEDSECPSIFVEPLRWMTAGNCAILITVWLTFSIAVIVNHAKVLSCQKSFLGFFDLIVISYLFMLYGV